MNINKALRLDLVREGFEGAAYKYESIIMAGKYKHSIFVNTRIEDLDFDAVDSKLNIDGFTLIRMRGVSETQTQIIFREI